MGSQGGATLTSGDDRSKPDYLLGASESEQARLDAQSATLAMPTDLFLRRAGIAPGMRVLDLGTGLGDVAFQISHLVGPAGAVVGVDQSAEMLAVAERRRVVAGLRNVVFVEGNAHTFRDREAFDAVVGRLIWCYLPDPVGVVRHHLAGLREDGVVLMIDQDAGSVRSEPPLPLLDAVVSWALEAHRQAGADPMIGARLGLILREAGLAGIETFGVQEYLSPDDPAGPVLVSGILHTLTPALVAGGIATREELGLDTFHERFTQQVCSSRALFLPPGVVGAWGRRPRGTLG